MALNYSHRRMSPVSFVEGVSEKNVDVYSRSYGRDRADYCSSSEPSSNDIVDLLPSDPFGMDIETTVSAITGLLEYMDGYNAITGFLEDLEEYNCITGLLEDWEGYNHYGGWNFIWNDSLMFQSFSTIELNERPNMGMEPTTNEKPSTSSGSDIGFRPECGVTDVCFRNESGSCNLDTASTGIVECDSEFEGAPHEAFNYVLGYLGVKDLLSVERVCRSLSLAVRSDPWFWKTIHIDQPLNEKITDDVLVQLAGRAQDKLECLSLVECPKITDEGIRRVLEANRRLAKLCVPGCTRISIECIVNCVRAYNSNNEFGGIKHVRIGGIYGVSHEHFEELNSLLGSGDKKIDGHHKPHYYHRGNFYLPHDDDRVIDIEMCPRCEKLRLVYDCPSEDCKLKDKFPEVCRACTLCIGRCAQCGRCINDTEFEETFCLELLCSGCFKQLVKYEDKLDKKVGNVGA